MSEDKPGGIFIVGGIAAATLAVFLLGHWTGSCIGKRDGHWRGRQEHIEEVRKERKAEEKKKSKADKISALKERVVFDFETCTVGDTTKAITVADVKVHRALKKIEHFEISVCGTGRYWYGCGGFTCRRVRRRDVHGNRINSYGNRIPER